jgi:hypothetical protein
MIKDASRQLPIRAIYLRALPVTQCIVTVWSDEKVPLDGSPFDIHMFLNYA